MINHFTSSSHFTPSLNSVYNNSQLSSFDTPQGKLLFTQTFGSKCAYVPTDPLCKTQDLEPLLNLFLNHFPQACFGHINEKTKHLLEKKNFYTKKIGYLHQIHLPEFKLIEHRSLRKLIQHAKNKNIITKEMTQKTHLPNELQIINQAWYKHKKILNKNQNFLLLPNQYIHSEKTRLFVAYKDQQLIAYQTYEPIYTNTRYTGYESTQNRYLENIPKGTNDLLRYHAIETFQKENHTTLYLGLSPDTKFSHWQKYPQPFYNHQGATRYKKRYHAHTHPIFFASNSYFPWIDKVKIVGLTLQWFKPQKKLLIKH